MKKSESALSEYDYMDENCDELKNDFPFSFSNEDLNENESYNDSLFSRNKLKIAELENFFTDLSQINQFVLTYGNKLLFKYKKSYVSNSSDSNSSSDDQLNIQSSNFSIDSSSVFMLLLEAANFLEYTTVNSFKESDEVPKSRSISPIERSVIESESFGGHSLNQENAGLTRKSASLEKLAEFNSYVDNFQSVGSTTSTSHSFAYLTPPTTYGSKDFSPSSSKKKNSFTNNFEKINENSILNSDDINSLSIEKIKNFNKYKKTSSFLQNKNKSLSFYEILYLKLNENLCLILLKANKLNKYCELISDFEALIESFIDLLNRKRLLLSAAETDSSTQNTFSPLTTSASATTSTSSSFSGASSKSTSKKNIQDERIDKTFFSFFMNKLILFYDKLTSLKNELNTRNSSHSTKGNGFFSKSTFKIRSKSFTSHIPQETYNDSYKNKGSKSINENEVSKQNSVKLIHTLQIKINQLSSSKPFKLFISFINSGQDINSALSSESSTGFNPELNNDLLGCFRMIESQINIIRSNLNDLFYELFLANFTTVTHELNTNASTTERNGQTVVFKSSHLINFLKDSFKKSLYHYTPFMDVKLKRNVSMSFYWHQFPGLIHFSFVNRQENTCVIPTIDKNYEYDLSEYKINLAYRKYMPIVLTFLYKNDCTQFQFTDDKLELILNYHIWFEDRKSNYIPVDFNTINQLYSNYSDLLENSKSTGKQFLESKNLLYQKSQLANIARDRNQNHYFGITEKSYYDLIKTLCYPNAPSESLTCYELVCIHTSKLGEDVVKSQFKYLVANFCQKFMKNNF
jgi:hypothetical protein